jgi:hypothetical protein
MRACGSVGAGAALLAALASPALAQSASLTGSVSALVDHLPNLPPPGTGTARHAATELRLRAVVDAQIAAAPWLRFRFAGLADGLAADRGETIGAAAADALEAWAEIAGSRGDLRAGMSRIAWGRLDEVQPTDVINPIDVSRYLLDGRSEARIAVPLVRARLFPSDRLTLEGVLVPVFRPGTFDRLDESTSPFNLLLDLPPPLATGCPPGALCAAAWRFDRDLPSAGAMQGGARLGVTTGRIDWSVSGWNGFVPFGIVEGSHEHPGTLVLRHPRFIMYGGDLETVRGKWAIRGEAAWFPGKPGQDPATGLPFDGDSLEAGAGVDRRAGDFTLFGTLLYRWAERPVLLSQSEPGPNGAVLQLWGLRSRSSASLVAGFSRTFNRDRVETRVFSLINPDDRAGFVRGLLAWKPADDIAVETSIGWFIGEGDDVITRFGDRDFAYVRLKYYFGR